jgi:DNA processing protein
VSERAYWLAWSTLFGVGPILQKRIYEAFGSLKTAWHAHPDELMQVDGVGPKVIGALEVQRNRQDPQTQLEQHERQNKQFVTPADPDYPRLLLEIPDPPPLLYYRGHWQPALTQGNSLTVGVVGTRQPTDYGRRWTQRLCAALAQQQVTIISGLADGIDAEAHHSCLSVQGYTVAVLGTGVDVVYPPRNQKLYEQVVATGLVLSEYPDGTPPDRSHFPRRNRIVAGLSRAVLMTEAPQKSGALITARLANEYCRDVYTLPTSLDNVRGRGNLELINQGAQLVLGEMELLTALGTMPPLASAGRSQAATPPPNLDPELQQVWQVLSPDPMPLDRIVPQVGLTTGAVLSALVQLELLGLVSQLPGMQYQRCS